MIIHTVDCDEQSNFYAVDDTGLLYFFHDEARNGADGFGQPQQIGQGWQNVTQLICGSGGIIYAVEMDTQANGRLLYFKDLARNGNADWVGPQVLSPSGWQNYTRVFSGGDGILYAIATNGDLFSISVTKRRTARSAGRLAACRNRSARDGTCAMSPMAATVLFTR
jgi:Tachylectin